VILWPIGFALAVLTSSQSRVLTLDDAEAMAATNAFSVRIAQLNLEKARLNTKVVEGQLGPSLSTQATYSRTENSGGGGGQGGFNTSGDSKSIQLSLSQIVDISGEKRKLVQAARFQALSQEAAILVELNVLRQAVRTKYFAALKAEELVRLQEATVASNRERLEKARIREQEGAIPKFDVLRLESEVKKSEKDLLDATARLQIAKQDLNNTLGRPIETEFELQRVTADPPVPADPTDPVQVALANRQEIRQLDYAILALERTRESYEKSQLPTLTVGANHTQNLDPGAFRPNSTTVGQAVISIPLFTSGVNQSRVKAAKSDEEVGKLQREQLQLGIALEVRTALTQVRTAQEAIEVARANEALAAEALRLADLRYNEGAGILLDVTVAQAELTAARVAVLNAIDDFLNAYAALQRAVGRDQVTGGPEAPETQNKDQVR